LWSPLRLNLVRLLLYAGDLTLLASTPQQLHTLLDCLRAFCEEYCLEVQCACTAQWWCLVRELSGLQTASGWVAIYWPICTPDHRVPVARDGFPSDSRGVCISLCPALGWFACHVGFAMAVWDMEFRNLQIQVQLFDALVARCWVTALRCGDPPFCGIVGPQWGAWIMICMGFRASSCGSWEEALGVARLGSFY